MLSTPPSPAVAPVMPDYVRVDGGVKLRFARRAARTAIADLSERGGFRAKFPATEGGAAEAVIVNTAGGLTGGDALAIDATWEAGAAATVTTQAAEKVYRSLGPSTSVATRLTVGPGASAIWAPQETILFDEARLERRLEANIGPSGRAVICESIVFGRTAMGEAVRTGLFRDRWRVRLGGRLLFAEDVRLDGAVAGMLARPAVAAGGLAVATVLTVGEGAEAGIEAARAALSDASCECAAGPLPGLIVARFLGPDAAALRADLARYLTAFASVAIPRSWTC